MSKFDYENFDPDELKDIETGDSVDDDTDDEEPEFETEGCCAEDCECGGKGKKSPYSFEDIMDMLIEYQNQADSSNSQFAGPPNVGDVKRFRAAICKGPLKPFNEEEQQAIWRAILSGTTSAQEVEQRLRDYDNNFSPDMMDEFLFNRVRELTELLTSALMLRNQAELVGASTVRDMGLFVSSVTKELHTVGYLLRCVASSDVDK